MDALLLFGSSLTLAWYQRKKTPGDACFEVTDEVLTISAPGKALVAGGYLVTVHPNVGVVIGVSSRFYTTIRMISYRGSALQHSAAKALTHDSSLTVYLSSPQFHCSMEYAYDIVTGEIQQRDGVTNDFVAQCLELTFAYAREHIGSDVFETLLWEQKAKGWLGIKLRAHNDFYSQVEELRSKQLPLISESLRKVPDFNPCPQSPEGEVRVAKTGMGSSAALTTSLVGALLEWLGIVHLAASDAATLAEDRRIVHNLAQLAHSIAQGKIGSGFDVGSATYGSIIYQRFDPSALQKCIGKNVPSSIIYETVNDTETWCQQTSPFTLPPGLDIVMGDVCGGSSTTSMAKKVMKWLKDKKAEATPIWNDISATNTMIHLTVQQLGLFAQSHPEAYKAATTALADSNTSTWESSKLALQGNLVAKLWISLRDAFRKSRRSLKMMGERAGVGIEPDEQTALANATEEIPGVLCSGVPGAGGVDAIFAITMKDGVRDAVERMWSGWSGADGSSTVCPLLLTSDNAGRRGVERDFDLKW
jgi:phosphomevalonate kinase